MNLNKSTGCVCLLLIFPSFVICFSYTLSLSFFKAAERCAERVCFAINSNELHLCCLNLKKGPEGLSVKSPVSWGRIKKGNADHGIAF
jgi:hypothetical protein